MANHFDIVAGIYQNGLIEASADRIAAAQRDRQEFLSLFPDHAPAQQMLTLLVTSEALSGGAIAIIKWNF